MQMCWTLKWSEFEWFPTMYIGVATLLRVHAPFGHLSFTYITNVYTTVLLFGIILILRQLSFVGYLYFQQSSGFLNAIDQLNSFWDHTYPREMSCSHHLSCIFFDNITDFSVSGSKLSLFISYLISRCVDTACLKIWAVFFLIMYISCMCYFMTGKINQDKSMQIALNWMVMWGRGCGF